MLTNDILRALYPRADAAHLQAFGDQFTSLFDQFGISANPTRLQFFLAQVGHESGGLTIMTENLNYSANRITQVWPSRFATVAAAQPFANNPQALANNVYANRMGNGPSSSGDGWRYRGRGYIQITGKDAYQAIGDIIALDIVTDPDAVTLPANALRVACGFWKWKDLNTLSDTGDFVKVTRRINGGTTGMADRRNWLAKVRQALASPPAVHDMPPADQVIQVQRALQAKGFREVGAADGLLGRRTLAAITRFRQERGLPPGGIDAALLASLGIV